MSQYLTTQPTVFAMSGRVHNMSYIIDPTASRYGNLILDNPPLLVINFCHFSWSIEWVYIQSNQIFLPLVQYMSFGWEIISFISNMLNLDSKINFNSPNSLIGKSHLRKSKIIFAPNNVVLARIKSSTYNARILNYEIFNIGIQT